MANKTKKQLADALTKALFGNEFINKDNGGEFERLGYVTIGTYLTDREPVMLYIGDNGVELHWMHDEALDMGESGIEYLLRGVVYVIDRGLKHVETDGNTMIFSYPDGID